MECSICYTNIADDQINTLSCSHYFHNSCVTTWINSQVDSQITPSCPICRCNTITDHVFENNNDNLPPIVNNYINVIPPRELIVKVTVDTYASILDELYLSTNLDNINNLIGHKEYYEQRYNLNFNEFIVNNANFIPPLISDSEIDSLNVAENTGYFCQVNWWMNKANTYNSGCEERSNCLTMASLIACEYAISL
jgi:hypothetical protein